MAISEILSLLFSGSQDNATEGKPQSLQETEIIRRIARCASSAADRVDICADRSWPEAIASSGILKDACRAVARTKIKVRVVTEITPDNVSHCKEILKFAQLCHKDNVMEGMWVVTEKEFASVLPAGAGSEKPQCIDSSAGEVLALQQFVFDRLWSRSTPAEMRIAELESGGDEKTEIFYGAENAVRIIVEGMAGTKKEIVACTEAASIDLVAKVEPIRKQYMNFKKRGVNFRSIFEITKENLAYCKELTRYAEIRHLDGIKGNFAVTEKEYMATATVNRGSEPVTEVIRSTSRAIMEQNRYFFESLWSKSIPAEQKIRELEEGIQIQQIEIIKDPRKSIAKASQIMDSTQKEFQVLFATHHTFALAIQMQALESYREMLGRNAAVKILVPRLEGNDDRLMQETIKQALKVVPAGCIRLTESNLNTRITIMISDRNKFMTWELLDDSNEDPYQAAGVATYSNMESLAASYATIFESLWDMAEMYENMSALYEQARLHDRAQNEFINMLAHELRTPVQPILGLAEVLRDEVSGNAEQTKLLNAIVKNAKKLKSLQETVLDVTRIEGNVFTLNKSKVRLGRIISGVIAELQAAGADWEGRIKIECNVDSIRRVAVMADGVRISQVLRNLLENALKFTASGTIHVDAQVSDLRRELVISVRDTGRGIDSDVMPRLFQKFATKSLNGTGLGLYISKNIVEAHGGRMWAENAKNGPGAIFGFSLPLNG